ncbi:putative dna repair protein rad5 [Phaeomoniella chlamydospora]|uniref:Putative dna repair protein rad5 n=1 Tax=Phaeomoniella chlamydospora TaxID=158046 RepID=A0A0G2GV14_PHACM|nr:putative dna repair protein rad5 [Phaeomoniella chlamydospora]
MADSPIHIPDDSEIIDLESSVSEYLDSLAFIKPETDNIVGQSGMVSCTGSLGSTEMDSIKDKSRTASEKSSQEDRFQTKYGLDANNNALESIGPPLQPSHDDQSWTETYARTAAAPAGLTRRSVTGNSPDMSGTIQSGNPDALRRLVGGRTIPHTKILRQRTAAERDRECIDRARNSITLARFRDSTDMDNSGPSRQPFSNNISGITSAADISAPGFGTQSQHEYGASGDQGTSTRTNEQSHEDNDSWMANVGKYDYEKDDAKVAEEFRRARSVYEAKKRQGNATIVDEVEMRRLEREHYVREEAQKKGKMAARDVDLDESNDHADQEDEESVFIPECPREQPKRAAELDDQGDYELVEPASKRTKPSKKPHRKKDGLTVSEIRAALPKDTGEKLKAKRKSKKTADQKTSGGKKRKDNGPKPPKGRRKKSGPTMSNIRSLYGSNIVADAQANAGQPAIPKFTATRRDQALSELIASIPNNKRGELTSDRQAIHDATRKFSTTRSIKSDGQGGWKLRGLASSLFHHQLLGAGWMRDCENRSERPHGGIVADEMGFGKSLMSIANIMDDLDAARASSNKTTLIVVTPALTEQWIAEFKKHIEPKSVPRILKYGAGSRIESTDLLGDLRGYDCIVTTYQEVMKSYPDQGPPHSLTTEKAMNEWWKQHFLDNAGPLHKIRFRRVVLDEAQAIKNPSGKTSKAVRALTGHYKWCITGTPIQNRVEELFAYFDFLKAPHTGSFNLFRNNYCENRSSFRTEIKPDRLAHMLQGIMLRRTHAEKLFSRPIVTLPGIDHRTDLLEFNEIERSIYCLVKHKFVERINSLSSAGQLQSNYRNILTMMHRLRMLTSHILLVQNVLKQCLNAEDVESLWRLTSNEVDPMRVDQIRSTFTELRKLVEAKNMAKEKSGDAPPTDDDVQAALRAVNEDDTDVALGGRFALTFKFRKFLRALAEHDAWAELHGRSLCHRCKSVPEDPYVTSCLHIYCKLCLEAIQMEDAEKKKSQSNCLECGTVFESTSPCNGLHELGWNTDLSQDVDPRKASEISKQRGRRNSTASGLDENNDSRAFVDWINHSDDILPSAKTTAAKAQILSWLEKSPNEKIVIFTQWIDMIRILERICKVEGWSFLSYHGKLDLHVRNRNVKRFMEDPDCKIMICSLKAGGVGLNLTSASKVLILDLFWNTAVERQAFCRCFRIGQQKKVEIVRYVVKDTIDEDLVTMQNSKNAEIEAVMGDETRQKLASLEELLTLFGPLKDDEDGGGFIYVEDDAEESEDDGCQVPKRPF